MSTTPPRGPEGASPAPLGAAADLPGPAGRGRAAAALLLALGVAAVSTGSVFARLADAPPLAKAAWRCGLATLVLAGVGLGALAPLLLGGGLRPVPRRALACAALAGLALAAHFATWIASLDHTSVATSLLLVNTTPVWIVLLAPWIGRERAGRRQLVGVALAVAGGAWLALGGPSATPAPAALAPATMEAPTSSPGLLGPGLALAGALSATAYFLIGRSVGARLPLVVYLTVCYGTATVALVATALATGTPLLGFDRATVLWLLALGLVPQLVGHSAVNAALRALPALLVALPLLLEPVVGSLLAWWALGEAPPARALPAGGLVLAGVALAAGLGPRAFSAPRSPSAR